MPLREFVDPEGVSWRAWDTRPGQRSMASLALPDELRQGWLSFECEHEKRRCAPIPEDWEFLSEAALCRLIQQAIPVRKPAATSRPKPPAPPPGG